MNIQWYPGHMTKTKKNDGGKYITCRYYNRIGRCKNTLQQ